MSVSVIQICNMALSNIGNKTPIQDLDEASQEAIQCALFYEQARDRVLRDAPWAFATKYATGQLVDTGFGKPWEHQWAFAYRYPTDCIFVRRVVTDFARVDPCPPPFSLGQDDAGTLIFTDRQNAIFEYTQRITDPVRFDAAFVDALVWRLAWCVAMPLSVSDNLRSRADHMYRLAISEAKAIAANERRRDGDPDYGSIAARN